MVSQRSIPLTRSLPAVLVLAATIAGCGSTEKSGSTVTSNGGSGGSAGSGVGGLSLSGGSGGIAPAGGTGGSGGSGMHTGPAQWLVFANNTGVFAYDAATFPATDTLVKLGEAAGGNYLSSAAPLWSPDGTRVMYVSEGALKTWDMSDLVPGPALTLATDLTQEITVLAASWSRDGQSVALISDGALNTLDPNAAQPELHEISPDILLYSWAPTGNGLLFLDGSGLNFVRVEAGVPTTPQYVDDIQTQWGWSPDGNHFATWDASTISFMDVSGPTMVTTDMLSQSRTYQTSPYFSFDGAFFSAHLDDGRLAYAASAAPSVPAFLEGPAELPSVGIHRWNPLASSLYFNGLASPSAMSPGPNWFVARFDGTTAPEPVPIPGEWLQMEWLPEAEKLIATTPDLNQIALIDMGGASPAPSPFTAQSSRIQYWAPNPSHTLLAFSTETTLSVADLESPSTPATSIPITDGGESYYWSWSSDGHYIALRLRSQFDMTRVLVVKVDGMSLSSPHRPAPTRGRPSEQLLLAALVGAAARREQFHDKSSPCRYTLASWVGDREVFVSAVG